jgi:hypothetical protein
MAKGIPLMGRDPDGKAKVINVDENGNVKVQQSGTFVRLSTEPRPSGREGDTLLLYDTKQVFIHDGTDWREW